MLAPRRYSSSCVLNMPTTCHGLSSRPSKTCLPTRLHPAHALTGASFISTVTGQCARHGGMPLLSVSKLQSTPSVRTRTLEPWLQPSQRGATSSGYSGYRPEPWATSKLLDTGIQGQRWIQSWIQGPWWQSRLNMWWQSRRLAWLALLVLAACEWWPCLLPYCARTPMRSPVALAC